MSYWIYNILLCLAAFFLIPFYAVKIVFTGKYKKSFGPKWGFIPRKIFEEMKGSPRIWVHAVSMGEVTAAAPIVSSLRQIYPGACIILSTSTETGQEMARRLVTDATSYIYYSLDIPAVVRKVMDRVNPDIFVPVETEIWPNFIRACRKRGTRVVMVNGRISPRSFKRYSFTKFFWKQILNKLDMVGTISAIDASRLEAIGVESSKIQVLGNAKYDSLAAGMDNALRSEMAARLDIPLKTRVFVAGSTHQGEDSVVLEVYRGLLDQYPDMLMIIVPRHPARGRDVLALANDAGFDDCITMTEINSGTRRAGQRIIVVDVMGDLFKTYSLATIVFCGGSLVPRGGQNILEPAAWGKVVLYGPSMDDFLDEKEQMEMAGIGIPVRDGRNLLNNALKLMENPDALERRGEAGRAIVTSNGGAALRYAEMIRDCLSQQE